MSDSHYGDVHIKDNAVVHMGNNYYCVEVELDQLLVLARKVNSRDEDLKQSFTHQVLPSSSNTHIPATGTSQSEIALPNSLSGPAPLEIGATRAFRHNEWVIHDSRQPSAVSAVGIKVARFPRPACTPWCSCICHKEVRLQTPGFLRQVVGSCFVTYSGVPILTRKCDQTSCKLKAQPMAYITYFFPTWFLNRVVAIMFTTTPMAGPVVSLKTQRTVPGDADIFRYAQQGRVDKLQKLFEGGFASPHDVHCESGVSALHVRVNTFSLSELMLNDP